MKLKPNQFGWSINRIKGIVGMAMNKKCTCLDSTMGYCPEHDGDYGKWKYGEQGEEWDE